MINLVVQVQCIRQDGCQLVSRALQILLDFTFFNVCVGKDFLYHSVLASCSVPLSRRDFGSFAYFNFHPILPYLTYCGIVWNFCKASDSMKLERVQERGLRAIYCQW